MDRFLV